MKYIQILRESIEDEIQPLEVEILQNPTFLTKLASGFVKMADSVLPFRKDYEDAAESIMKVSERLSLNGFNGDLEE